MRVSSKAVRPSRDTAAGATEVTERQQEQQQLNVGIMLGSLSCFSHFLHSPSHFPLDSSIVLSPSLSFLSLGSRERGRERGIWRERGDPWQGYERRGEGCATNTNTNAEEGEGIEMVERWGANGGAGYGWKG